MADRRYCTGPLSDGRTFWAIGLACGLLVLGLPLRLGIAGDSPPPVHFGVAAGQSAAEARAAFAPLLAALKVSLGVEVMPHISNDYASVVWAIREASDAIAWLGNKSAIEAVDNADADVFARTVSANGENGYYSLLILRSDSPYATPEDLFRQSADLTLGLGDPNSTSGYLWPAFYLFVRNRIDPLQAFAHMSRGTHESAIFAVAEGRVDAAAVASDDLSQIDRIHPDITSRLKVIWRSPKSPSDPFLWRRDLSEERKSRIRDFPLRYGDPGSGKSAAKVAAERQVLRGLGWSAIVASDNRQLLPVRQVELYRRRRVIDPNPSIGGDDRKMRLHAIDHALSDIERALHGLTQ